MKKIIIVYLVTFVAGSLFSQQLGRGDKNSEVDKNDCITFIDEEKIKSKVGSDRRLIGFIPGTLGRDKKNRPPLNCETSHGKITIFYIVNKNGVVIYARRDASLEDVCVVSSVVGWVQKYVKAERSSDLSYGRYTIDI
ncbi:hypothetical protein [Chryseobacterium binzhouense]|uniref:hypothetical protein n=1 Tax=Chryseobacterium binzhouense TaxID=2593646 RepID=UPI0011812FE2|nr:hypothetical protein [Chryseobacterium binzhouense]